jgi:hypothetical protein
VLLVLGIPTIVGFLIGLAVGRYRSHSFQNHGEARLSRAIEARFKAPDYYLLNHLTLDAGANSTQIDHVLVSRFGIFVIETKEYSGWIFGDGSDKKWTQVLYRAKFRFRNPVHQNDGHVSAVQRLLEFLPNDAIASAVVFTGTARFKTTVPDGVYTLNRFLDFLATQKTERMSPNRVQFCVGRLETARRAVTKATDLEHVEQLRRRYGRND